MVVKAHPARKAAGLTATPAVKIRKLVARSASLAVVKKARREQSILLAVQHQGHAEKPDEARVGARSPLRTRA